MTPPRTHGLIQAIVTTGRKDAADLRAEAEDFRERAKEADKLASVLEALDLLAAPYARPTSSEDPQ